MRNAEAARYARWSGIAAILIAAGVAGVFLSRSIRENRARRNGPKPVSAAVQQESAEFSFSKVEQDRTIYTVRASRATQFKDQDLSVLEDVSITMYGIDGSRNDTIHTRECKYEAGSGRIRCEGAVHIEVKSAPTTVRNGKTQDPPSNREGGAPTTAGGAGAGGGADAATRVLKIDTSDVTFDRDRGFASTSKPVQFQFPNGDGKAVGIRYDSKSGSIDLDHDVEIHVMASKAANAVPVTLNGNALHYDRGARVARLEGAARARQGERELTAQTLVVELDADMHARHATALGHPQMRAAGGPESLFVKAGEFQSALSPAGWIETVSGSGNVEGERKGRRRWRWSRKRTSRGRCIRAER
jgi:lipopolysaccharide export system protein LptC